MSDNTDALKDSVRRANHERALRLLRESLQDASAVLSKTLVANSCPQPTASAALSAQPDEATSRMIEMALERYSEQLSTQVCELFRRKLDQLEQQQQTDTTEF